MNKRIDSQGYSLVFMPGHPTAQKRGWCKEHRMVWHDAHGSIPDNCVIHHVNGDKQDNRIDNLQCVTRARHAEIHFGDTQELLESHRHIGTAAMIAMNQETGPWNKDTAEVWSGPCDVCGNQLSRVAREVRKNRKRGWRVVCSRKCAANQSAKAKGEA